MIVPCFNEATRMNLHSWGEVINRFGNCYWIFVNDGSTDDTGNLLNQLQGNNVRILDCPTNLGKGEAIRFGFNYVIDALSNIEISRIGYLDADGAFDLFDIESMFFESSEKLRDSSDFDVIIGSRVQLAGRMIDRDKHRHYLGRIISTLICLGWKSAPYDTQSGFKIFRLDDFFKLSIESPFLTRWFFDIELLLRLERMKLLKVWEYPVMTWREIEGSSIRVSNHLSILIQILRIRALVARQSKVTGR